MKPTVGRIVHYRAGPTKQCQAAAIVKVWSDETVNLVVFRDGSNDQSDDGLGGELVAWQTSCVLDAERHNWHWPEREEEA